MTGQGGWPLNVFLTPDAQTLLRRHLLPRPSRHGLPSFRDLLRGIRQAWTERRERGGAGRSPAGRRDDRGPTAADRGGAARAGRARRGGPRPRDRVRRRERRLGSRPEVPATDGHRVPAEPLRRDGRPARDRDGAPGARRHGRRRHPRPPGRRIRALLDRRALARAALREDALRQRAARPRVPPCVPGDRRHALPRRGERHARLRAARDDHARGALDGEPGRRHRRPRGPDIRLDARRDRGPRRPGRRGADRGGVRGDARRELRGADDPVPGSRR